MTYLNWTALDAIDDAAFRAAKPYPWVNPEGTLTDEGRRALIAAWPDFALFTKTFGMARNYGQQPHDRWELRHDDALPIPEPWKAFIAELRSTRYRDFIRRLYRRSDFELRFEWHMATHGNSVSPPHRRSNVASREPVPSRYCRARVAVRAAAARQASAKRRAGASPDASKASARPFRTRPSPKSIEVLSTKTGRRLARVS